MTYSDLPFERVPLKTINLFLFLKWPCRYINIDIYLFKWCRFHCFYLNTQSFNWIDSQARFVFNALSTITTNVKSSNYIFYTVHFLLICHMNDHLFTKFKLHCSSLLFNVRPLFFVWPHTKCLEIYLMFNYKKIYRGHLSYFISFS